MSERCAPRPNKSIMRPPETRPVRRGFEFKKGRIIFMNNGNTIDVGMYNQCSCTAQTGGD